jgi:hypothetical protein
LSACEHEPCPELAWYVPALQFVQLTANVSGWTDPALQLVQLLDEIAPRIVEYLPTPQTSHWVSAVLPVPVWYFPPTHWIQLAEDTDAWLGLYVPAAHRTHALSPDPLWYCP